MAFNWVKFPWTNLHDLNLDWIIQTVKTLEENLSDALALVQTTVDTAITKLITGSGDLTISKTGDVNISGNSVQLSRTVVSDASEQLTLNNPNSRTNMTANYNNGVLTLTNNQNSAKGVAVYAINTPADGGGDNSDFAANVGYVKGAVAAVDNKIDTEITNRTSGDAALQSTIDNVIMPLITALQQKAIFYINADVNDAFVHGTITLDNDVITQLKTAMSQNRFVIVVLNDSGQTADALYLIINNYLKQLSNPSEFNIYFKDVKGEHVADINTATRVLTYSEF